MANFHRVANEFRWMRYISLCDSLEVLINSSNPSLDDIFTKIVELMDWYLWVIQSSDNANPMLVEIYEELKSINLQLSPELFDRINKVINSNLLDYLADSSEQWSTLMNLRQGGYNFDTAQFKNWVVSQFEIEILLNGRTSTLMLCEPKL